MGKKKSLTLIQHVEMGRALVTHHLALQTLIISLANTYGITSGIARKGSSALNALDGLRAKMDDQLVRDHGDDWCAHVYYPGTDREHEVHIKTCTTCILKLS